MTSSDSPHGALGAAARWTRKGQWRRGGKPRVQTPIASKSLRPLTPVLVAPSIPGPFYLPGAWLEQGSFLRRPLMKAQGSHTFPADGQLNQPPAPFYRA